MLNFENIVYLGMFITFLLGTTMISFVFPLISGSKKIIGRSWFFRLSRKFSVALVWISWVLMAVLCLLMPNFHWAIAVFSPPLLIISAFFLWKFSGKLLRGPNSQDTDSKIVNIYLIYLLSFFSLFFLQYFFRYIFIPFELTK